MFSVVIQKVVDSVGDIDLLYNFPFTSWLFQQLTDAHKDESRCETGHFILEETLYPRWAPWLDETQGVPSPCLA